MANIKSQIKRDETSKAQNKANSSKKNDLRTSIKKFESLVKEGKKDEALAALKVATSKLDKLAGEGVISVNSANRKKASLQKAVAAL